LYKETRKLSSKTQTNMKFSTSLFITITALCLSSTFAAPIQSAVRLKSPHVKKPRIALYRRETSVSTTSSADTSQAAQDSLMKDINASPWHTLDNDQRLVTPPSSAFPAEGQRKDVTQLNSHDDVMSDIFEGRGYTAADPPVTLPGAVSVPGPGIGKKPKRASISIPTAQIVPEDPVLDSDVQTASFDHEDPVLDADVAVLHPLATVITRR
jgi:hypothetical protein